MCKRSESIGQLAKALIGFNGEVNKIEKDAKNPHFKNNYASLDNIIDEIRPILTKHGLAVIQMPGGDGDMFSMTTMLVHESGEWIESDPIKMRPVKNDPQGIGSCTTYARRYSLSAFLSLNTGEDDDGNGASYAGNQGAQNARSNTPSNRPTENRQNAPAAAVGQSGGQTTPQARVYKLREEMGWQWADLNTFASDVLQRDVKYLKNDVKGPEEWAKIEQAMIVTKNAS